VNHEVTDGIVIHVVGPAVPPHHSIDPKAASMNPSIVRHLHPGDDDEPLDQDAHQYSFVVDCVASSVTAMLQQQQQRFGPRAWRDIDAVSSMMIVPSVIASSL
jgi:hypothetical protein